MPLRYSNQFKEKYQASLIKKSTKGIRMAHRIGTHTLLIIVFVGGSASLRGVIFGSLLFGLLPNVLELVGGQAITPAIQQIIYGIVLVAVMIFLPSGLNGLVTQLTRRLRRKPSEVQT